MEAAQLGEQRRCLLLKSPYGLRRAPRQWHAKLREELEKLGFVVLER
jgi:hypothetical protein